MIAPVRRPDDRGGLDHLGPELLTWLWWRSDTDPRFVRPDGTEVFVHLDDHLEFRGERAASRKTVLRAGAPSASREARGAVRSGKLLVAARVLLASGDEEAAFTLRAEDLDVSGLRLPTSVEPGESPGPRERLLGTLDRLDAFYDDLDLLLAAFLEVRTGAAWPEEARRIRAWSRAPSPDEARVRSA